MAEISADDYKIVCQAVRGYSGLDLGDDKVYLIETRIKPILSKIGFNSFSELCSELRKPNRNQAIVRSVSEALATHESLFFRDRLPFDYLAKHILPKMLAGANSQRKLRIWSAACSVGQEPYSIVFTISESNPDLLRSNIEIVATDFSSFAIERAKKGVYTPFESQRGLNEEQKAKFFIAEPMTKELRVRDEYKKNISFKELNFLDSFLSLGVFDIIFCRNVLIYFTTDVKKQILERMSQVMSHDGYLILGNTESVLGITEEFIRADDSNCSVYTKQKFATGTLLRKAE